MNIGRILKGIGGFYYVSFNGSLYESKATALFRKNNIKLAVGDYVEFYINDDGTAYIKNILERKNLFIRPSVANIDEVLIVFSINKPKYNYQLIDRMILLARYNGLEPKLIITKADLDLEQAKSVQSDYEAAGFDVHITSNKEINSILDIRRLISKKTIMFMGVSGVGKSTLISELTENELETGEISAKTLRGKHTTRHVELLNYNYDSYIVDTPGFSSLSIDFVDDIYELEKLYLEFYQVKNCKFSNCLHVNEPKCTIKEMVEKGKIQRFRYENYLFFHNEIKNRR